MFQDLTLQQFCALDYKRNMVVTSGPGAGKTKILSNRFCFILLTDHSVSIPNILTLTFTEKAAEEMKARIYKMISRIEREFKGGADDRILLRIREIREQFNKNRISTIHSFCANLLRENPIESGIDPGFSIIQGARQRDLMEESVESAVTSIWRANRDMLVPLLQSFGSRRNLISALNNIVSHPMTFEDACDTGRRLFDTKGWSGQVFSDYCRVIANDYITPYLKGLKYMEGGKGQYDELMGLLEEWRLKSRSDHEFLGIPELFASMRALSGEKQGHGASLSVEDGIKRISYGDLLEEFYPDIFCGRSPDLVFEREFKAFMEVSRVCLEQYSHEKRGINSLDFADLETQCHSFLTRLALEDRPRLKKIQKDFRHIMVDEFQDTNITQWEIIRMLCSDRGTGGFDTLQHGKLFVVGDKRQAIYRFRGGDVTVFESVTEQIRESNPEAPEAFFWQKGEMDQMLTAINSRYPEFRDSHAHAFDALSNGERKEMLSGNVYLSDNFRTDAGPIDFLNRVFKDIFGNRGAERLERYETPHSMITMPEAKRAGGSAGGSAAFYLIPPSEGRSDPAEREAALIADIIEGIIGRKGQENHEYRTYGDIRARIDAGQKAIGILFFRFTHVKIFEAIFREAGLNFIVHRGKGFYRCPEVMEIIQLLNYISDSRHRISLLSALRSPIFGMTDAEVFDMFYSGGVTIQKFLESNDAYIVHAGRQLMAWRFFSSRLTVAELIRLIIKDRGLIAINSVRPDGRQRLANIEKLIETARGFQSEGSGSLPEFVVYCLRMAEEEEEEGEAQVVTGGDCPVTLMTVHAAKGLEFPMIIVPDLDHQPPDRLRPGIPMRLYPSEKKVEGLWNSNEGSIPVWQVEIPELGFIKKYGPLGYLLGRRNSLEALAENRRVFYVACTRAMNHLLLLGSLKKRHMEGGERCLTSGDYRERASILDILDDIFRFNSNFPPEGGCHYPDYGGSAMISWREPEPRGFKGIEYKSDSILPCHFGQYSERIRGIDLTDPVIAPSYFQISFKALKQFKECTRKFYYNVILGLREEGDGHAWPSEEVDDTRGEGPRDDETDRSENALRLGLLVHGYLERHRFGEEFNHDLFDNLCEKSFINNRGMEELRTGGHANIVEKARAQLVNTISDKRLIKALGGTPDYPEAPFLVNISRGVDFRGVIDRVFRNRDNGCWSVIDWKSNDLKEMDPKEAAEMNNYFLQLACYKYAVERITGEKAEGLYIYFTDTGDLIESSLLPDAGAFLIDIGEKIREYSVKGRPAMDRERLDMSRCRSCGYREALCRDI